MGIIGNIESNTVIQYGFKITFMSLFMLCITTFSNTCSAIKWPIYFDSLLRFGSGFSKTINYKQQLNLHSTPVDDEIVVHQIGFGNLDSPHNSLSTSSLKTTISDQNLSDNNSPRVLRKPLVFPNPFRQEDGGIINYELSTDMDVTIHIYDMTGNRIFEKAVPAGGRGAQQGNNVQVLDNSTFDGYNLSAGIYFIYLIHNDAVVSKGKLAVIP